MGTEERQRRVEQIFGAALQSDPGHRPDFVYREGGADEDLRREVESLLRWENQAGSFLHESTFELRPEGVMGTSEGQSACSSEGLPIGDNLGPYSIVALLGAGGMGQVYSARNTRLGRMVALKILPPFLADDPRFNRQLLRVVRAASALNHRGIVMLHDVGRDGGVDYLVMQCVRGTALDKLIPQQALPMKKALQYAIETTDAIAVAHAAALQ